MGSIKWFLKNFWHLFFQDGAQKERIWKRYLIVVITSNFNGVCRSPMWLTNQDRVCISCLLQFTKYICKLIHFRPLGAHSGIVC
jgi:hypothetical protein